ncbi:MAG: ADP-ribosylglycohydrolase family protein [Bacillota bacterium]|jgi:ADP-ribosylglycohydrolase
MRKTLSRYDRVLGCLLGAAVGDAMGAATETKSTRQIEKIFGGRLCDFQTPPDDVLARGRKAGQITDAFSIPYILTKHLINSDGKASRQLGGSALLEWGKSEWFAPFAGMTTRKVINRLNEVHSMGAWDYAGHLGNKLFKGHYYALSSNGAGVKAYPAGLLHPDDLTNTIEDTIELTMASHDDPLSISGACAIAAAISKGMGGQGGVYDMVQAARYGAEIGGAEARIRDDICVYPGPSVTKRIDMAIELVLRGGVYSGRHMEELRDLIGCGPAIAETVPTAIGLFIAHQGETMPAIYDAVNIGDETSAIATIVGALCGVLKGKDSICQGYLEFIEAANGIDLQSQAKSICALLEKEKSRG